MLKYDAPKGELRDPDVNLEDISYDGILEESQMKGGLGQLVDGLYGDDDYQKQLQGENSGRQFVVLISILSWQYVLPKVQGQVTFTANKKPSKVGVAFLFISQRVEV